MRALPRRQMLRRSVAEIVHPSDELILENCFAIEIDARHIRGKRRKDRDDLSGQVGSIISSASRRIISILR